MLDNRIYTFLELCKVMHYRKTAENLCMTQPAVTQHIKYLEQRYHCKLFTYDGKTLHQTEQGRKLERMAQGLVYTERGIATTLATPPRRKIAIGATKTIGEYTIENMVMALLQRDDMEVTILIDNTHQLLERLHHFQLDLLLLEGNFDKNSYGYRKIKTETMVGICACTHPFAGRAVALDEIFAEHIILREDGSGTRAVFDAFLQGECHSLDSFDRKSTLSSYKLIERAIAQEIGISFVYQAVAQQCGNPEIATFTIKGHEIAHPFHYVYLKGASVEDILAVLAQAEK